jgi:centromeric protein E
MASFGGNSANSSSSNGNFFNRPGSRRHNSSSSNVLGQPKRFTFDHLFVPGDSTAKLYRAAVRRVVVSAAAGYHGSVCAYGQTATGKTYTMQGTNRHPGLMPLAVRKHKKI